MAKRRGNNEGTVFKTTKGKWRAQVSLHGKRLSFTAKTQWECQEWIKKTLRQKDQGYNLNQAQTTLQIFLNGWLVSIKPNRAASTIATYRATVANEIIPHIGKIKLKDLRPDHIQKLYDLRLQQGGTPYTVKRMHKVLHCALKQGVKLGLLVRNPASVVTRPKLKQNEMKFFTEEQAKQFLLVAKQDRLYALYYLAIHTGMRKSELLGLRWKDVDWENGALQVQRQLRYSKGHFEFPRPKTRASVRSISLGDQMVTVLREHQAEQQEEHDLIFTSPTGEPIKPHQLYLMFKQLIKDAELPDIRFHDLRHTAASIMLNYGIPVVIVSKRLGHAKASITMDVYAHIIPNKQKEAAQLMDQIMLG